jgi:hypothetical protein
MLILFAGPFGVINEHLNTVLPNSFDAIGLMLMIRLTYHHQVSIAVRLLLTYSLHCGSCGSACLL